MTKREKAGIVLVVTGFLLVLFGCCLVADNSQHPQDLLRPLLHFAKVGRRGQEEQWGTAKPTVLRPGADQAGHHEQHRHQVLGGAYGTEKTDTTAGVDL